MSAIRWIAAGCAFVTALPLALGPAAAVDNGHFVVDPATGFAADGHDPVAYFVDHDMREGSPDFEARWKEVAWRFVNEGNRAAFLRDPLVYAPGFGGHCPVALARGFPAEGDPRIWSVYGNRLYFFHSLDNQREFIADPEAVVADARTTWERLHPF